ncbi:hypothetical protein [Phytohabitans aurantiacus]|jgi:hypothetical protein|uniref:DUF4177 domain-containing protein n=1 Tax=Phytohabitans aurantiacus TaxID=3016789 RepID=A0ABQ5QX69_9ACTN|nr:hypothetical protein [Phytohabitans aurantiacus]GLH98794.1 hypothetical protein Pa4123_40690 [Phytohabitans aurantiacus]
MNTWEYALLVRRREASGQSWRISFYWYSPDGDRQDVSQFGDTAIAQLNLAGKKGWELVSSEEDINNLQGSTEVHRYYLKRPSAT